MATKLFIPKTRLDLAKILSGNNFDVNLSVDQILRALNLEDDKRHSVLSLLGKISINIKKSKKSVDNLNGDWWEVEIPWNTVIETNDHDQSSLQDPASSIDCNFKLDPNIERRKHFDEIQLRSKKIRLDQTGILSSIRQLANLEKISVIRYVALLLYLVATEEIGFKSVANIAWKIYNSETLQSVTNIVSPEKSTFLAYHLKLGKGKWRELKYYLQSEGLVLSTWEKIREIRSSIVPTFNWYPNVSNPIGVYISYLSHVTNLFDRLLRECPLNFPAPHFYPLNFIIKHGLDGSGSHSSPHLMSEVNMDRSNYIVFMVSPLQILDRFGNVLWENRHPNSCFSNQPVALICQKETIDTVMELSKLINPEIASLNENGIDYLNGHVNILIKASMFDGKTLAVMTGKGGAPCIACKANRSDINNIAKVVCGFPLDCSIEDIKETILQLTSDGKDLMSYKTSQRFGITHEPASDIDVVPASPLHSYLRILDWFLNLIYRLAAGKSKWTEDQTVRNYRSLVCNRIDELTNLLFDQPGGSGNTSTGNMARTFFSYKKPCFRIALSFVPSVHKDVLTEIHMNLSALLRVANSCESVNVERLRALSQETYLLILKNFPWVSVSNTLHKFLAHVHQFIERNNNVGLCNLSEEGLEQGHKLIREFSIHLCRKSNFFHGLSDVAMRLYIYGCPVLNEKFMKIIICSFCGEVGHQKNCPKNRLEEENMSANATEDSRLQNSIDDIVVYLTVFDQ